MRIALVMTIRDEGQIIETNIRYHTFIGITDFFIFLDRLDIRLWLRLRRNKNITLFLSDPSHINAAGLRKRFSNLKYSTDHMVRQMTHIALAFNECKKRKIDWLVNADADELLCTDIYARISSSLSKMLSEIPRHIDAISLRSLEVIPTSWRCSNPFIERQWFKKETDFGEGRRADLPTPILNQIGLTNEFRSESCPAKESAIWEMVARTAGTSEIGPLLAVPAKNGSPILVDWYTGHGLGKEIVRVGSNARFVNLHRTNIREKLKYSPCDGALLHYNNFSFRNMAKKYRNFLTHPDQYASGWQIDPLKKYFRDAYRHGGHLALLPLYRNYCVFDRKKLATIRKINRGLVHEIRTISNTLDSIARDAII